MPSAAERKALYEAQHAERLRLETEAHEWEERELQEIEEQEWREEEEQWKVEEERRRVEEEERRWAEEEAWRAEEEERRWEDVERAEGGQGEEWEEWFQRNRTEEENRAKDKAWAAKAGSLKRLEVEGEDEDGACWGCTSREVECVRPG